MVEGLPGLVLGLVWLVLVLVRWLVYLHQKLYFSEAMVSIYLIYHAIPAEIVYIHRSAPPVLDPTGFVGQGRWPRSFVGLCSVDWKV